VRRNGKSVTPDIGASRTLPESTCGPMRMGGLARDGATDFVQSPIY
jgi:hypothetical protein